MNRSVVALMLSMGLAGGAVAADLYVEPAHVAPVETAHDWTGFYAGVFGGYGAGNVLSDLVPPPQAPVNVTTAGFLAGARAGYNHQFDSFVLGVEGDVAWTNINGSVTGGNCIVTCGEQGNFLANLKGRAGFAADRALFYVTAGVSAYNNTSTTTPPAGGTTGTFTATYLGYVAGAGVELAVTDNVSIGVEYNFSAYAAQTAPANTLTFAPVVVTPNALHIVKAGVNWHF